MKNMRETIQEKAARLKAASEAKRAAFVAEAHAQWDAEDAKKEALARLGARVLEILKSPQTSTSYRTVNRAADCDLIDLAARSLGLLQEEKP